MLIDGRAIARDILNELKKKETPQKTLAAILVGNDSASLSFLKQKEKIAAEIGAHFKLHLFPASISEAQLEEELIKIVRDHEVGGIILQLPLPAGFDRTRLIKLIPKEKDVDGLNGAGVPPTVGALEAILDFLHFGTAGKHAVVVGRGILVGAPIAAWLKKTGAYVIVTDRDDFNYMAIRGADLVVSGAGVPGIILPDFIKPGTVVIDFGSGMKEGKVRGDADAEEISRRGGIVTPTPGGTGPVVVAELFRNFYRMNK